MPRAKTQRKVTVDEVSLNVVGVSIKAVQIGKKQMTLSVFRQLPNEAIWDYVHLKPGEGVTVWGFVNYFWDSCGCSYPHGFIERQGRHRRFDSHNNKHIVFQSGDSLCRSCVSELYGEAASGYPLFEPETASQKPRRGLSQLDATDAWYNFYTDAIAPAEQLFIAV